MIDWFRDLLPEHLWIDLLAQGFGESGCLPMFNRLLDRQRPEMARSSTDTFPSSHYYQAPERDEILLGLYARLTRLFFKMCTDSSLWAQDMAGILLRCLAESGIVFAYLSRKGTPEEFAAFRSYGEGKQKLLMLHLQDTYSGSQSLQGKSAAEVARSVNDGAWPEFVNIELDNWTKQSARDLALAAEFEKYYRLVYDPSSADVHGTWMSLDQSGLTRCRQPLHRYHRLPGLFEPPAYAGFVRVAHDLYAACLKIGIETLGFPRFAEVFEDLPSPLQGG